MQSPFDVFLESEALRTNRARLAHLASLGLDLDHKRVLEIGAGIGLHTEFFEQRGCDVLSTDGAPPNVAEMLRRWPDRALGVLDLDHPADLSTLGMFDVVFCYGTLYHLRDPDGALARLATVCSGVILLETIVSRGAYAELNPVSEPPIANQAVSGIGCRPTRSWVMSALRRHFGHAYTTLEQPEYPDFITDWSIIGHSGNLRAVFVGARQKLAFPTLAETLPIRHWNAPARPRNAPAIRVWIDVGAHRGENSRAAAQHDPGLTVHAFEPLPMLFAELTAGPPNYHVHAMAVGEQAGMAAFRINRFAAASSLLPMNEAARAEWTDGHLLREERIIQVPVTRLDSFLQAEAIRRVEFLKVDAQGGDLAVLRSAGDRLADIDRVQLEVTVAPAQLYQGAADKAAVLAYMTAQGFRLTETQAQTHGQEENLTFVRADAGVMQQGGPIAPADHDTTMIGLYDFAEAELAHGQIRQAGNLLELVASPEQWAYAAVIPIGATFREGNTNRYRVEIAVQVEQGMLQIGILNRAEDDFPSAAIAAEFPTWQSIVLITPPLNRAGPLVIRNAADAGASRARCRLVAVTDLAANVPVAEHEAAPSSPQEAEALAAQILASSQALAPMVSVDANLAMAVGPVVVDAASRLRRALVRGGHGLILAEAESLAAVFASLTTARLSQLAVELAKLAPLHAKPGWRFDGFLESGDLATFVRYALWLTLCRRTDAEPVILPWHAGTRLGLNFRNDLGLAAFVSGCFEPNEFALLSQLLEPGMTVLDGGANEGAYAVFLGALVGPLGQVIAVEPSPRERERLQENARLNGMAHISLINAALAEQPGEVDLLLAEAAHAGQNTLGSFMYPGVAAAGSVRVPATTIDLLVGTEGLMRLDMVKLDLEGAELRALTGAQETLRRWRPLVLLECAPSALSRQGASLRDLRRLFDECGYQMLGFDAQLGKPVPLIGDAPSDSLVSVHRERNWGLGVN
jgi:FkbM family methyltransferase